jgi:GT2 family glycosyltransferase
VLVFLDGHCNPEPGALRRLVEDVEELAGQAIVTPRIPALSKCWTNQPTQVGHGYRLGLETFDCGWLPLEGLRVRHHGQRKFYESPALIGCALAIARELYDELHGFDPHMFYWGVEDLDFGLRAWLLGHPILHDPEAAVGHRFRQSFDNYSVPFDHLVVNQLRMARKNFTQSVWSEWLERCRQRSPQMLQDHPEGFWAHAWELFQEHRDSVESERAYIHSRRERDEFWYAERFGLSWPKLGSAAAAPRAQAFADQPSPSPSPSPSPPPSCPEATKDTVIPAYELKYKHKNGDKPALNASITIDIATRVLSVRVDKGAGFPVDGQFPFAEVMQGTNPTFKDTDSAQFAVQWKNGNTEVGHYCNAVWLNTAYQGTRTKSALWTAGGAGASEFASQDVPPYPENADHVTVVLLHTDIFYNTPDDFDEEGTAPNLRGNGFGDMPAIIGYWTGCRDANGWHLVSEFSKVLCYSHQQQMRFNPLAAWIVNTTGGTITTLGEIGYTLARRPVLPAFEIAVEVLLEAYETNPGGNMDTFKGSIVTAINDAVGFGQINLPWPPTSAHSHDTGFDITPKWDANGHDPGYPASP